MLATSARRHRLLAITALVCAELVALAIAYQFLTAFECRATEAEAGCRFLGSLVARALSVVAALGVMFWARPSSLDMLTEAADQPAARHWPMLHVLGFGLTLAPAVLARGRAPDAFFDLALGPWLVGGALAGAGVLFWIAPPQVWGRWLRGERGAPLVIAAVAAVIPDLAEAVRPVWDWSALTRVTFLAVERTLRLFSPATYSDPESYVIGVDAFFVQIARQCSGVEGFALVTGFILLYAYLFREQTRFPRFWLVLPVGLALSWGLNVLRIAALILIGARVSPDLAVNGFHSYAGWLFFTLLALSLLLGLQAAPWLRKRSAPAAAPPRLRDDWAAARILPFVAFMAASVAASALFAPAELGYPLKAVAMAAALALFRGAYRGLGVSLDPVALGAGAFVGLVWVAMSPPFGAEDAALALALADLGALAFAAWAGLRLLGAVLLVPLVEELFFRGYVQARLDSGGLGARVLALAVSSALFAVLHGRWFEAGLAGLVFGLALIRRGRLADAVTAHVVANLIVALWAVRNGQWGAM